MFWLCAMLVVVASAEPVVKTTSLSGRVTDALDHSPLVGVSIYIPELSEGTTTDVDGRYLLKDLPAKSITLQVSYVGHQTIIKSVDLTSETTADFVMAESNALLNEVVWRNFSQPTWVTFKAWGILPLTFLFAVGGASSQPDAATSAGFAAAPNETRSGNCSQCCTSKEIAYYKCICSVVQLLKQVSYKYRESKP